MMKLNTIGAKLSLIKGVTAMTDVTGFGLLGHLKEMCEGSKLSAIVNFNKIICSYSLKNTHFKKEFKLKSLAIKPRQISR